MITLFNYLFISNVFTGGFILFSSPFEFCFGYIFIISFLIVYLFRWGRIEINTTFIIILMVLTVSSFINVYLGNDTIFLLTKTVSGILITGIAYYLLIKINKYDINMLFNIYLRIAIIVSAIGIFQEFSFLIGFKYGYDYSYIIHKWNFVVATSQIPILRLNSVFMEPSHFAISLAPAFFVSLLTISKKVPSCLSRKVGSIIIIISYILTFSAVAWLVIFISLSIILLPYVKNFRNLILVLLIMLILFCAVYKYSLEISMRVNDTVSLASGSIKAVDSHFSIYALLSNGFIAFKSFTDNPLFGHGLGSHPITYDKYIRLGASIGLWKDNYPVVNKQDAGSLFLRLISETGLFGIIVVFYFLFKFRLRFSENNNMQIISNAIFILFIVQLLRQGNYFYNGLFFFVWVYYFAYKKYNLYN